MITHSKGFTLVETMVAITVLALALIGPFSAVQNALNASYVSRDQLVAAALAQEGIEYIRSIRDNNFLNNRSWIDGLTDYTECYGESPNGYCTVDPTLGDFHSAPSAMEGYSSAEVPAIPPLFIESTNYFFNQQDLGSATKFKRMVRIETLTTNEMRVTVLVSWVTARQSYSMTLTDTLQNWI